jgi:hypothetical protein
MAPQLLLYAHLLVIGCWLGSDLAVYHLSGSIVDPRQPLAVRVFCARTMARLDMLPRSALILTLAIGTTLAISGGWLPLAEHDSTLVWIVAGLWLALVWLLHRRAGAALDSALARLDLGLRGSVVLLGLAWARDLWPSAPWLAGKLALMALIVTLGVVIRLQLRGFAASFARVAAARASSAEEQALSRRLAWVKLPVWMIWIALLLAAALAGTRH